MSLSRKFKRSKRIDTQQNLSATSASLSTPDVTREVTAWHEAAHAVVGHRLGMTLHQIEIRTRIGRDTRGNLVVSSGATTYMVPGLADRLGVEGAYRARAVFAAAGIVAEMAHRDGEQVANVDDLLGIRKYARALGLQDNPTDEPFIAFFTNVVNEADRLLFLDEGNAWSRVAAALQEQLSLSPEQVAELVG